MTKIVFEHSIEDEEIQHEDGNHARILDVSEQVSSDVGDPDSGIWIRLIDWNESGVDSHPQIYSLVGKKIRITIETLE